MSRALGEGIEYADLRSFVPGDPLRSINWRVTARRGGLWVNDRHPERATNVVLFMDSFRRAGMGRDDTLGLAVEAAMVLSERHLGANDRVGLLDLGGVLRWIMPSLGARQLHQITETLLATEIVETYADKGIEVLPLYGVPSGALVLAFSPLIDRRAVSTLFDLRARGFDVVIIECSSDTMTPEPRDRIGMLAARLWAMEREAIRSRFRHAGVVVVSWSRRRPLATVLDEVIAERRRPRRTVAG